MAGDLPDRASHPPASSRDRVAVCRADLILRSLPPGPREARPDDKLRKRLEGWTQHQDSWPSFETRARGALLRMRSDKRSQGLRMTAVLRKRSPYSAACAFTSADTWRMARASCSAG